MLTGGKTMLPDIWVICFVVFVLLSFVRYILAGLFIKSPIRQGWLSEDLEKHITVLQPILSGDPALRENLRTSLQNNIEASFIWLVDEDDQEAQKICRELMEDHVKKGARVLIKICPSVPQGKNPKVFKLDIGFRLVRTRYTAVVDDDVRLPKEALSRAGSCVSKSSVVTGMPLYLYRRDFFSSLLAAFVNSQSILTYGAVSALSAPKTLNGMYYLAESRLLEGLEAFERISMELCDDYALARLCYQNEVGIIQSAIPTPIVTTVTSFKHYVSIMRRWMLFANRFLKRETSLLSFCFVVTPSLMPLVLLIWSFYVSGVSTLTILMTVSLFSALSRILRSRLFKANDSILNLALEILSQFLIPLHLISAFYKPKKLIWRQRQIDMRRGRLEYQ